MCATENDTGSEQTGYGWTAEVEQLLKNWHNRAYAAQSAYYMMADRLRRRHYRLGIPVVLLSSMVSTTLFADVEKYQRIIAGLVSLLAGVLAALQTFLRPAQAATEHGFAADWYAAIRREIEELLALPRGLRGDPKAILDSIRKEMNKAGQKAPELDESLWVSVAQRFGVQEPPPS